MRFENRKACRRLVEIFFDLRNACERLADVWSVRFDHLKIRNWLVEIGTVHVGGV